MVIPCLNEAGTIEECVRRARAVLDASHLDGEVIVVDNGSEDGSGGIAATRGHSWSASPNVATEAPISRGSAKPADAIS